VPVEQSAPLDELNAKSTAPTPVPVSVAVAARARLDETAYEPSAGWVRATAGAVVSTNHAACADGPVVDVPTARTSKVWLPTASPVNETEPLPVPGQVAYAAPSTLHSNVAAASFAL
jgi:hypothetical protein